MVLLVHLYTVLYSSLLFLECIGSLVIVLSNSLSEALTGRASDGYARAIHDWPWAVYDGCAFTTGLEQFPHVAFCSINCNDFFITLFIMIAS